MPDTLLRASALEKVCRPGHYGGGDPQTAGLTVCERRYLSITQVAAYPGGMTAASRAIKAASGLTPSKKPVTAVSSDNADVLWVGPNRWWVVMPEDKDPGEVLAEKLADKAAVTAQGHGRLCLRLAGPALRAVLAKGSTLDFHHRGLAPGDCPQTPIGHFASLIHCRAPLEADVYVARSYGVSFWEWLSDAAAEYGYQVAAALDARTAN